MAYDGTLSFATVIDTSGYENGLAKMSQATEAVVNVTKQFGKTDIQTKIAELRKIVASYTANLRDLESQMRSYQQAADNAFAAGDEQGFEASAKDLADLTARYKQTTEEANGYKLALEELQRIAGQPIDTGTTAPLFFKSDADYQAAEQLKQKIAELQDQITHFNGSDEELQSLRNQLSSLHQELAQANSKAAEAASRLGADLGGRAAESSTHLYELNNAVIEQQAELRKLQAELAKAKEAYDSVKASADPSAVEDARMAFESLASSVESAENRLRNLQAAQSDAQSQWNQVSQAVSQHDSVLVKMLGGQEKYNQIISNLPPQLQSVIGGITGMTGAAKAFIATPLGAVIAALVLGLQALKTWFDSSAEGQRAFAQISGWCSGVLGALKEVVISVGNAIYNAFTEPKKAAKDFVEFLKGQVMNRVKAVGETFGALGRAISAVFKGEFDDAKEAVKDMGKAYMDFVTGVEDSSTKLGNWVGNIKDVADATARIKAANMDLDRQVSAFQVKEAEANKRMTELYTLMLDNSISKTQRKKYMDEYRAVAQEVGDAKVEIAKKRAELHEELIGLTTSTNEDYMEQDRLNAEVVNAEAYVSERLRMLQRMDNRLSKADAISADPSNKIDSTDEKTRRALERQAKDLELSTAEARIEAMEDGEDKVLAAMALSHQKELEQLKREKEDYLQAKIDAERQKFEADPKNKGKKFNSAGIGLTDDEQSQFDAKAESLRQKQMREEAEFLQSSVDSMRSYLAQYGTFQQQKLAIAEEYAEKIRLAQTEGDRLTLEKERDQKIASAQVQSIKDSIDWAVVFGEFGSMFADVITPELDKARKLANSDEFKKTASVEDIKALNDAIREMEQAVGDVSQVSFKQLGEQIGDYQQKQDSLKSATADLESKTEAWQKAGEELKKAQVEGTDEEKKIAQEKYDNAQTEMEAQQAVVEGLEKDCSEMQTAISDTAKALQDNINGIVSGLQAIGSGSVDSARQGISSFFKGLAGMEGVSKGLSEGFSKISEKMSDPILGLITSLLDVLQDGISNLLTSMIDAVLGSVNNILSDVLSGSIITNTGKSLLSGIGSIFNTISFGGFKSLFGNSNAKEVAEVLERNTTANEILTDALNNLKDEISGGGQKSVKAYQEAVELQKKINDNTLEKAQAQAGYHGSHHSWNYYMGGDTEAAIKAAIRQITEGLLGQDWSDIWELTPEQMQQLLSDPDLVDAIKNLGKGGYGEQVYEYLKEYADQAGQLEDLKDQLYEALTTYSFDSMVDEFTSSLMDMSKSASDFADDFSKMMMQSMLNNQIANIMESDLQAFYDKWAKALENETIESELDDLQSMWDSLVQDGLKMRDSIAAITGYDSATSQNSTKGGFTAMSQDTADELNGRFTALQMSGVAIENTLSLMLNDTTATRTAAFLIREQCDELLNINMLQLTELEAISKNTKELYTMNQRLEKIEQNTSQL